MTMQDTFDLAKRLSLVAKPDYDVLWVREAGVAPRDNCAGPYDLVVFDLDWTLVWPHAEPHEERPIFPRHPFDREWMPARLDTLRALRVRYPELRLGIATNQGGPACGHGDYDGLLSALRNWWEVVQADATSTADLFRSLSICFHCPPEQRGHVEPLNVACEWRKPGAGQLLAHVAANFCAPDRTLYVGDLDTDRAAAVAAGVAFTEAKDFFKREV